MSDSKSINSKSHLNLCRRLTAFIDLGQLLSHGLNIWQLHLLVCFQQHFVDILQQPALPVATLLLYSRVMQNIWNICSWNHCCNHLKTLHFIKLHKQTWKYFMSDTNGVALCELFCVIPFPSLFNHNVWVLTHGSCFLNLSILINTTVHGIKMVVIDHGVPQTLLQSSEFLHWQLVCGLIVWTGYHPHLRSKSTRNNVIETIF